VAGPIYCTKFLYTPLYTVSTLFAFPGEKVAPAIVAHGDHTFACE
jgi:hypothetical protein